MDNGHNNQQFDGFMRWTMSAILFVSWTAIIRSKDGLMRRTHLEVASLRATGIYINIR